MISVSDALQAIFDLIEPVGTETVTLPQAAGRVLAEPVIATRAQPPFAASAMDGYALNGVEADPEAMFRVIGESAAGSGFSGRVGAGECVRIFTGAPMPYGTDRVIIQEDVSRKGDLISLARKLDDGPHVRPAGGDFKPGDRIRAPQILSPADLSLAAAMNVPELVVAKKPVVALITTGNELVMPGETPGPDQIIASNGFGLKALIEQHGAEARILPIARDNMDSLRVAFDLAGSADLIVTTGGASVGDHDLVAKVAADVGMDQVFYKVAMRPGKPLMAGRLGKAAMIGLPGNPVSAMVCGHVFLVPAIRAYQGLGKQALPRRRATLTDPVGSNGPREHYMRAFVNDGTIKIFDRQDSALLSVLSCANALAIRPPADEARAAGEEVEYLAI